MKKAAICLLIIGFAAFSLHSYSQPKKHSGSILRKDLQMPAFTMNFNLVGIALYGPIIQAEIKVADRLYVVPWLRYSYAGIASQYEWTNFESFNEYYPTSIALGLGVKAFIPVRSKQQMIYYGGFGEFIHEQGLYDKDVHNYEYEQTRNAVAVYGNLGYRWNSKKNFYVDMGILPGFAFDIKNEATFTVSQGPVQGIKKESRFIGMLDMAFGWNLKR
jgi:hypothetical protein